MNEIEEVIKSRSLTDKSKTTYRNNYIRLVNVLQESLREADEKDILKAINEIANNSINNKLAYINIPILIKQLYNKPVDVLLSRREELFMQRDNKQKESVDLDLPKYNDVKKYVNDLYDINKVKYIVNYLIFNYGVRNKDVNVFITAQRKSKDMDTNKNYLLVKNREIEWIRNDYKTITSFGQQSIIIKSKKFIDAVKSLALESYLLSGNNKGLSDTSLNNTITRMLYKHNDKHLTEGQYFKIIVGYLQTKPNSYSKIVSLGEIRGTNADTIEKYYNISK